MTIRKNARGIATQNSILMAARLCFSEKGFFETNMADIELASKTSRGVLYHHFKNKEEIIQRITQDNLGAMADKIATNLKRHKGHGDADLRQMIEDLMELTDTITLGPGRAMSVHVWSLALTNPTVHQTVLACFEKIRLLLKEELIELQAVGKLSAEVNVDHLSSALFSVHIPGFIVQRLFLGESSLKPDAFIDAMIKLFSPKNS